jgi:GNAT superfamily N-acetyltransferase
MAPVEIIVTFLEMTQEPLLQVAPPSKLKLMLMRAEKPAVGFYRYLCRAIGKPYRGQAREGLSDTDLAAIIHDDAVEIWVAYANGQPAGYFELDASKAPERVELEYLGILPDFQGLGMGKWLIAEAIRACWSRKPQRIIVQTSSLDSPAAFTLYQKMGFVPYAREEQTMEIESPQA